MADKYIISGQSFVEHRSLKAANIEHQRLTQLYGNKKIFKVYRIKTSLVPNKSFSKVIIGLNSILKMGKEHKLVDAQRIAQKLLEIFEDEKWSKKEQPKT